MDRWTLLSIYTHFRYIEVLPGQICCPDLTEDRVDVGYGDRCCASIPYMTDGAQICCNGMTRHAEYWLQLGHHIHPDCYIC